jgi:Domain of unknown function (DUF6259)
MSLTLDSGRIYLEVEPEHGRLVRFGHRPLDIDLLREPRLAENFRLLVPLPSWRGHYVMGREQRLTDAQRDAAGHSATLTWAGVVSSQGRFDITARLHIRLEEDDAAFVLELENHSGLVIEEAIVPALGGLANWEEQDHWRLHHTSWTGVGQEWPVYREFPGTYLGPPAPVWMRSYGGRFDMGMAMPWIDVYDTWRRRGMMLANLDPNPGGALSMAYGQLFPCTNYRGQTQCWPDRAEAGETPVGLTLAWAAFPFLASGASWSGSPVVAHFHTGIWYAAADYYRAWFDRTMPVPVDKSGSWLAEQDAWQSTIISYPEDTIGYRFADLPKLATAARQSGIGVIQIDGWDIGGIDRDYPYYTPDPRLGSADDLRAAIAACRDQGVETLLFANLQWAHIETEWYRKELYRYAVQDPHAFARNSMGWEYHTLLGLANQCEPRMVPMDPAHPGFRRIILDQLSHIVALGAAGTQIDKLGVGGGIDYHPDVPLPRDRAIMQGTWETLRDFVAAARAVNPRFCVASETHWDRAIPFADASYARFFSQEHLPTVGYTFPEFRQTCCIVGHYDYGLVNNCLRYGHIVNVEARCLHGSAADAPQLAAYVREVVRLRRGLWEVLWHSRVVEPLGVEVRGDGEVLYALHRSHTTNRSAMVLNHFARDARTAVVELPGENVETVTVHRPFERPVEQRTPLEVKLEPDGVAVLVWSTQGSESGGSHGH